MQKEIDWLLNEKYHNKPNKNFYKDIKRLNAGEPLDYVIGFTNFLGCKIDLSKRPLIPRSETEFWAEKSISDIKSYVKIYSSNNRRPSIIKSVKVLDIFAGSGCIGVAVLKHVRNAQVVFMDKDESCLKQVKTNLKINNIEKKGFEIIKSDVFSNIKGKFDFILANPPYIPTKNKSRVRASVLKYEPKTALFSGKDGLFYIREFLKQAKNYLLENGKIYMEFDSPQKSEIEKLLKNFGYENFGFHKDQYQKWRYLVVKA